MQPNRVSRDVESLMVARKVVRMIKPYTLISDQDRISPYKFNEIPGRQVMRIKKISIRGLLVDLANTKFSKLT